MLDEFLTRAYMAGTDAGVTEMVAQAAEQGLHINLSQLRAPSDEA